jgi:hypothetical protein
MDLGDKRRRNTQNQTKIAFLHIFTKSLVINHSTNGRSNWNLQTAASNKPYTKEGEVFESQNKVSISPCKHESVWSFWLN